MTGKSKDEENELEPGMAEIRRYFSDLKSRNSTEEDMVAKEQLLIYIEKATTTLKQDVSNEVLTEMKNSFLSGGNTEHHLKEAIETNLRNLLQSHQTQFSKEDVSRIIETELVTYDADKTGRFDFALESAGGTIASTRCTQTYDAATAVYSVWGIPIWWESVNGPRAILQPGANPGQCWAVRGDGSGDRAPPISVVIRLSDVIEVHSVTLEHIPETLSPDGNIGSAPKEFSVLGLRDLNDPNPILLGRFTYVAGNRPVQTFHATPSAENTGNDLKNRNAFNLVELKVHSNYGNSAYTCIYRFRVHGNLSSEENKNLR